MIFELTGERAFDRQVAGVVNSRGHFVGQELSVLFEEFDGEHSDVLQFVEDGASGLLGGALNCRVEIRRRRQREAKNSSAMMIFDERIDGGLAGAGADGDDAELTSEWDKFLKDVRDTA